MPARKGRLFIISAPSGCGKTTLCDRLLRKMPRMVRSVSLTTRPPRKGESNGRDYIFVTQREFRKRIAKGGLLEWAKNFGYYYGTPKRRVETLLSDGVDVILAIDVKGAMKIKRCLGKGVYIFILPPSLSDLQKRLRRRRTDDKREISKRMKIARRELTYARRYDYVIVNDNLDRATRELEAIVTAERCRVA